MGLASSQARLLLLTARKSDLEYRAQAISQRKMNIAMQTQQLATEYSTALSNKVMKFVYFTDGQSGKEFTENLSYAGLIGENSAAAGDFLVKTVGGNYLITGDDTVVNKASGMTERKENEYRVAKKLAEADGTIGSYKTVGELINAYKDKFEYIADANNSAYFQSALRNGSFYLYQASNQQTVKNGDVEVTTCEYKSVAWSAIASIRDENDTSDDAEAEANYEAKSLVLANQDKMLDLELQQIQTQHTAIETEYDSVKKVIENNIKVSFKIFS